MPFQAACHGLCLQQWRHLQRHRQPLDNTSDPAPTTLDVNARYDKLGEAFGAKTYYVTTPDEFATALKEAIASKAPALIDVQLAADSGKESGHIGYLNPAPLIDITV